MGETTCGRTKCNLVFLNLLHLYNRKNISESALIREFFETEKCDHVFDMSSHRFEYAKKLGEERLSRILAFEPTTVRDERVAQQAVIHYRSWHQARLLKALEWKSWIYFRIVTPVERALVSLFRGS
jgi:hypothetical protein